MRKSELLWRGRLYAAAFFFFAAFALCTTSPIAHAQADSSKAETVRPEVGRPLLAAQELMKAKKFQEALAKVREADAIANKTPYENFITDRMRGSAAAGSGESDVAARSFEAVINAGHLPAAEQLKLIEAIAGTYYRAKNYNKVIFWAQRYLKEGGTNSQVRTLLVQAQFLNGDFIGAAKELSAEFSADDKAGRVPSEERLQLLANCYVKLKDYAGYAQTLERLVTHYPKKDYWADLIARIQRKPGFADRLALDVYRLQLATYNLQEASDYVEMTQLAIQAGLPAEAKRIVNEGFARNVLGSGAEAERQKRLRDLAARQAAEDQKALSQNESEAAAAKDGNALTNVGYAYVTNGQCEKGIALMEQGLARGGLKRPEDAKLHLGIAYLQSGNKARALSMLKTVQGSDGVADLARLWGVHAR